MDISWPLSSGFSPKLYRDTQTKCKYMGVSKNRDTPKSSILIGFSIINHPFWGYQYFWKPPYRAKSYSGCCCGAKNLPTTLSTSEKTVRFWNASGTWERTVIQTSWKGESPTSAFRTHMTFHYTDRLIGIITMAYGNPYIKLGRCNPPKTQQITRVNWSLLTWIYLQPHYEKLWVDPSLTMAETLPETDSSHRKNRPFDPTKTWIIFQPGVGLLGFHWLVVFHQPIWKLCPSNWIMSSTSGMKIKDDLKPSPLFLERYGGVSVGSNTT